MSTGRDGAARAAICGFGESAAPADIDLAGPPRQCVRVRVFQSENGLEAKREAGAVLRKEAKAGAAPATVSGEPRVHFVSLTSSDVGKAGPEAVTREPGDLPRQITSSGGVPGQVASMPDLRTRAGLRPLASARLAINRTGKAS